MIHQTGAATAEQTFNSYRAGGCGAHFLIDKAGKIYQTARLNRKAYHVGRIKSRCYATKACTKAQLQAVTKILFQKDKLYSEIVKEVHHFERSKPYPDRFPLNSDSLGIEIVGAYRSEHGKMVKYTSLGAVLFFIASCSAGTQHVALNVSSVTGRGVDDQSGEFCRDFTLDVKEAQNYFSKATVISIKTLNNSYDELPCFVKGSGTVNGESCLWEVRAGGTGRVVCETRSYLTGCSDCLPVRK